jgi:hypothetical protein
LPGRPDPRLEVDFVRDGYGDVLHGFPLYLRLCASGAELYANRGMNFAFWRGVAVVFASGTKESIPPGLKPRCGKAAGLPGINPRPTAPGMGERAGDREASPAEIKANEGRRGGILVSHPSQTGVPTDRSSSVGWKIREG